MTGDWMGLEGLSRRGQRTFHVVVLLPAMRLCGAVSWVSKAEAGTGEVGMDTCIRINVNRVRNGFRIRCSGLPAKGAVQLSGQGKVTPRGPLHVDLGQAKLSVILHSYRAGVWVCSFKLDKRGQAQPYP